ncbi:MAG: hypothetical protein ACTSVU_01210 [Promethearchaeota archaeon]
MKNKDEKDEYVKELENFLTSMMKPFKNVPFNLVIKGFSGYNVIPFKNDDDHDRELLEMLKKAAELTTKNAHKDGIYTNRRFPGLISELVGVQSKTYHPDSSFLNSNKFYVFFI